MKTTPYSWAVTVTAVLMHPRLHSLDNRRRIAAVAVFAAVLAMYVAIILIGGTRTFANTMAQDNLLLIDGAYRMLHGALPHIDFMTPLGVLNFAGPALFSGNDIMLSVARYSGAIAVICTLLSAYVATTRLNLPLAILFVVLVAVLAAAPSAIGYPADHISFAMVYNRQGYACLLLLLILPLPAKPLAPRITLALDSALIAATLLFLLHTKITFFVVATGLCAVMFVTAAHLQRALVIAMALFAITVIAVALWQPDFYAAYAHDIASASLSRADDGTHNNWRQLRMRLNNSKAEWLAALVAAYIVLSERRQLGNRQTVQSLLLYFAIIGCAIPLILLNSQLESLILTTALFMHAAMLLYGCWRQQRSPRNTFNYFALLACAAFFALSYSIPKAGSLDRYKRLSASAQYEFEVPAKMQNFIVSEEPGSGLAFLHRHGLNLSPRQLQQLFELIDAHQEIPQTDYSYMIAAGARMLKGVIDQNGAGCVFNFDFTNPYNVLLNLPICKHDYLWLQPYVNISPKHFAPASRVLTETKYITVPKLPALRGSAKLAQEIYGSYLKSNFEIVAESDLWQIWQRSAATQMATR